jgi:excisionase family DNA binding protein
MSKGSTNHDQTTRVPMLTVDEVADLTSMSVPFWRREIRLRRIPVTRFGRAIRISEADLDAY